jgi:hypothetical protein
MAQIIWTEPALFDLEGIAEYFRNPGKFLLKFLSLVIEKLLCLLAESFIVKNLSWFILFMSAEKSATFENSWLGVIVRIFCISERGSR